MTNPIDALAAAIAAENAAKFAKEPTPPHDKVVAEAKFLKGWSKGKSIVLYDNATSYYKCGKWLSKVTPKMVAALLEGGYAVGSVTSFRVA